MEAESLIKTPELVACTVQCMHCREIVNLRLHMDHIHTEATAYEPESLFEALGVLTSLKPGPTPSRPVQESGRVRERKQRCTSGFNMCCCFPVKPGESFKAKVLL